MAIGRILIIGAGIGGLSAGLALQRRGFNVVIYERAPEVKEIGAGLIVTANARRALDDLGIDKALEAISSCSPVYYNCDYRTRAVVFENLNDEIGRRYGFRTLNVHRADLHSLLLQAFTRTAPENVRPAHEFVRLEQQRHSVRAVFSNGHMDEGDALIGADGNASAVRSFLFPNEPTTFNGQMAFRALIPAELVQASIRKLGHAMHPAPKRYLLIYPLRGGKITNIIGCGQTDKWEEEGWAIPSTNEEFASHYSDFAPDLLDLIHRIPAGSVFKWGLRDREPLANWTCARVGMLGDAAHPMTPFLGQGACLAIEDALVLGRAFAASSSVEEALTRYENARKSRGNSVQLWSRDEGRALQDPTRVRRTAVDRGLLEYDPVTVPV
jgi:salicylate hydroxylase